MTQPVLKRPNGRTLRLAAVALSVTLGAAACGGDSGESTSDTTAAPNAPATTAPPASNPEVQATLNGSGATFPQAFYGEAIASFKQEEPGVTVNYQGVGSGAGRTALQDQVVDFAGTDGLVKEEDKPKFKGGEFIYIPTVAAPITVPYNLPGVTDLKMSPEVLGGIFSRQIKTWNDPKIAADNPGVQLPATPIQVAHRSDSSGTTENFTKYLAAAAPAAFPLKAGSTVEWPADTLAAEKNSGVGNLVKSTPGAIGYVDLSDAKELGLSFADVKNKSGQFVEPTVAAASAALEGAEVKPDLTYNPLNAAGAQAYPITAPTWIITYKNQTDPAKGRAMKAFFQYLLGDAQDMAEELDYAKLPDSLKQKAMAQIDSMAIPS